MKLKFIPNQQYQLDAIGSIVSLFEGMERFEKGYKLIKTNAIDENDIVPNIPPQESLEETFLLENLQIVQGNNIEKSIPLTIASSVEFDSGLMLEGVSNDVWNYPNFTVEMETGTGKTYVYLRTIHELYKAYGFNKYIIVVPSVAIYEGVLHSLEITKTHFKELFSGTTIDVFGYDSAKIGNLRTYATSSSINVMVITIAAFNSKTNNIFKSTEKLQGELLPYEYIQKTRPIIIMDEPQNMESDKAKQALRTLKPLFALRYSATHKTSPNLVYRLTPVEAFRQNLVKKIQVIGVSEEENLNQPFLSLLSVSKTGGISAKVRAFINKEGKTVQQDITLKQNDELFKITHRPEHQNGYKVEEISVVEHNEFLRFENGITIKLNDTIGSSRPTVFRWQIRNTIEQHIEMQNHLEEKGIKVLSLFFIDRVANYINNGLIRRIFDEEFEKIKQRSSRLKNFSAEEVQSSYFASYRQKPKGGDEVEIFVEDEASNEKQRKAEKDAFELIMKKKEELLSFSNSVSFIFAHSALKEGWDNPNVFQICTLNTTISESRRRQEIGRGLRLAVNQVGERVEGDQINILTVIANESYESFANNLQKEYRETGDTPPPRPTPKKKSAQRRDVIFNSQDFQEFWQKIAKNTTYQIKVDTDKLIKECNKRFKVATFPKPIITVTKGKFVITEILFELKEISTDSAVINLTISNIASKETTKYENIKIDQKTNFEKIHKGLRGFKINNYITNQTDKFVEFTNGSKISFFKPLKVSTEEGQKPQKTERQNSTELYPVFNFIERAAFETGLTKTTLLKIYQKLPEEKRLLTFMNPEGFTGKFIEVIKECLADHVAENLEFSFNNGTSIHDINKVFPAEIPFVQRETIPSNEYGLYEYVQVDSEVEKNFVNNRLHQDDNIVFYFKFPSSFRIHLPRIIGNYNPDWGIVREDDTGKYKLQLVRETKGKPEEEMEKLRFSNEKRKIICAKRHFTEIGINYRAIDDKIENWYLERQVVEQSELDDIEEL